MLISSGAKLFFRGPYKPLTIKLFVHKMAQTYQHKEFMKERFKTTINTFETMLILKEYKCHFIPKNITAS